MTATDRRRPIELDEAMLSPTLTTEEIAATTRRVWNTCYFCRRLFVAPPAAVCPQCTKALVGAVTGEGDDR